ncbi:signal peptidase I [Bacillus altitudinis]|uniref:signal peptidase I n=1 Tax=Bacillus altitudinis TaxID=293387 RepID=UPI002DBFA334|nr:signal peptidase I [Bacillus altitudinis]MEC0968996.1 signal peptidase I [Bacillus altitudinis]MEC1002318.1 signal peptidase I [Bacillus altitudinis]
MQSDGKQAKKEKKSSLFEWIKAILIALALVLIIRTFIFEPYVVEGESMEPTLHDGEKLFVNKTINYLGGVKRGDILIINGKDGQKIHYVKRLIGLPGDTIEMKDDTLYINGKKVDEPYLKENKAHAKEYEVHLTGDFGPVKVPKNDYFVMGDNRLNSMDSRNGLGLIEKDRIVGTSEFVFFPFGDIRQTQ